MAAIVFTMGLSFLGVWEIPIPEEQLWAVEGRREMGQVYRDGLWVRFEDEQKSGEEERVHGINNSCCHCRSRRPSALLCHAGSDPRPRAGQGAS